MDTRIGQGPFELHTQLLGPLPVINHFCARLGLERLLVAYLPAADRRCRLAPAAVIGVVVRNLICHREPVYALGPWAAPFDPALLGLAPGEVGLLNDDRVGRSLVRLFDADRASLLTRLLPDAITGFGIDTSRLHTDTTSIRFSGAYRDADGRDRGGQPTAAVAFGHSKDHRPDLTQLVWSLTVTADGAVPVCYRVADGNTGDDVLHIPTWDALTGLLGRSDFLSVADCTLASRDTMDHLDRRGGRFLSVLPRSRAEDEQFRDQITDHDPGWVSARRRPGRQAGDPDEIWWTAPAPWPSAEGYRIVWVRCSSKIERDAESRRDRIARAHTALDTLNQRLASPKTRIKTIVAVEHAANTALEHTSAARWIRHQVSEHTEQTYRQEKRGRPGTHTRYRRHTRTHHRITWQIDQDRVVRDAASDGCYPLISNDRQMTPAELLDAYKWQPHLEQRHAQLKGTQLVAPMFLHAPARIEGLLCCHFIAMLIQALIERQIRSTMTTRGLHQLPIYPEDRASTTPTAARVLETFTGLPRHHLLDQHEHLIQTFEPELTTLQHQILNLLNIPHTAYLTPTPGDQNDYQMCGN